LAHETCSSPGNQPNNRKSIGIKQPRLGKEAKQTKQIYPAWGKALLCSRRAGDRGRNQIAKKISRTSTTSLIHTSSAKVSTPIF
jgi:hypothetical protein